MQRGPSLPHEESGKHYKRVAELIRKKIASGELPSGSKVSHTAYAAEFGVSRETVKSACDRLADVGLLQRGHGHRVPPAPPPVEYAWLRLPINGRPEEAAAELRAAMSDEPLAALVEPFSNRWTTPHDV
ncbi:hypothetical protein GCM10023080_029910 [Streptomyces pseudoechinosporeus]